VRDVPDPQLHQRFAADLRGQLFSSFSVADLTGASAVQVADGHLDITIWRPGEPERVVRKH
jgi:hypothetical protein